MKITVTLSIGALALAAALAGCATQTTSSNHVTQEPFGTADGKPVTLYTLRNSKGAEARICNYGGILVSLKVPDRAGKLGDVVLGYDNLQSYVTNSPFFGALIGRYGNRIAKGKFTLDGVTYTLATNNAPNTLHGGDKGFDKRVWEATPHDSAAGPELVLTYLSKDREEGYPGNLKVKAVYTLTDNNELKLEFTATTDKPTVVNLTHHSYFNLAGKGDILGHIVFIPADRYTPVDSTLIPTGIQPVAGTPFDFQTPTAIGARIENDNQQLKYGAGKDGGGYDHNWIINKPMGQFGLAARVYEPTSGRVMEVWSDEPALQFYSGNFLDGTITGKGGWNYKVRNAFCMEPQHYPDSPNQTSFPSSVLRPGQTFHNTIVYRFSVRE